MSNLTTVQLKAPYLILIGDLADPTYTKTGQGIVDWRPDLVAGQLRFGSCPLDMGVPDMSIAEAAAAGVKSLLIGVAPVFLLLVNSIAVPFRRRPLNSSRNVKPSIELSNDYLMVL